MEIKERMKKLNTAYKNGKIKKETYEANIAKLEAELEELKRAEAEAARAKNLDMLDCPTCGAPNLKTAMFCNECGMETQPQEKKVLAEEAMDDLLDGILDKEITADKKIDDDLGLDSLDPMLDGEKDDDDLLLDDLFDSLVLKDEEIDCPLCGVKLPVGTEACPNCDAQMSGTGELIEEVAFDSLADSIEEGLAELEEMAEDIVLDETLEEGISELEELMDEPETAEPVTVRRPVTRRVVKPVKAAAKSKLKPKPEVEEDIGVTTPSGDITEEEVSKVHLVGMRVVDLVIMGTLAVLILVFIMFKLYYISNFNAASIGLFFGIAIGGIATTFLLFRISTSAVAEGDKLLKGGKYQEALAYYEKAIKLSSKPATAWTSRGVAQKRLGDFEGALRSHNTALKLNPKNEIAWCNKGDLMFRLNKYNEALECYENALDLNSRYAIAWNNKGTTLARLRRYDEAKICQDMATRLRPKYAAAWVNKGEILAKMGKRNEAIACYKRAKKLVAA